MNKTAMRTMRTHIHPHGLCHIVTILILVFETIHDKAYQLSITIMESLVNSDGTNHHESD
jgi:hypothetical protein